MPVLQLLRGIVSLPCAKANFHKENRGADTDPLYLQTGYLTFIVFNAGTTTILGELQPLMG